MIIRLSVFTLLLYSLKPCRTLDRDLEDIIAEIFGTADQPKPANIRPTGPRCESITGELATRGGSGCYDCYNCDSPALQGRRTDEIQRLTLNTESCDASGELCCVTQPIVLRMRTGGVCGVGNPDGAERRLRRSAGEVLAGEYPWTVAIYSTPDASEYLCGGALVSLSAVVTTARCADSATVDQLAVRLGPGGADHAALLRVQEVVRHDNYTNSGENDVALLTLTKSSRASLPKWAMPVCLPDEPPLPSESCLTANKRQKTLYSRTVSSASCSALLQQAGLALHASQLCTAADLPLAAAPEHAAPLVCQDEASSEWTVQGLASYRGNLTEALHLHTALAPLTDWIRARMKELNVL